MCDGNLDGLVIIDGLETFDNLKVLERRKVLTVLICVRLLDMLVSKYWRITKHSINRSSVLGSTQR